MDYVTRTGGEFRTYAVPDSYVYEQNELGLSTKEACEKYVASLGAGAPRQPRRAGETGRAAAVRALRDAAEAWMDCPTEAAGRTGFLMDLPDGRYEVRVVKKQASAKQQQAGASCANAQQASAQQASAQQESAQQADAGRAQAQQASAKPPAKPQQETCVPAGEPCAMLLGA